MSVYLLWVAVCKEDARIVCVMGVYVYSPSLISHVLRWPCTQQQDVTVALQGHLLAGREPEAGFGTTGGQGMHVLLKAEV